MGNLIDVLSAWLSGRQTTAMMLCGLPMVWWGRIGKCLQFVAGCAVILDLIGPRRLRATAARAVERRCHAVARRERLRALTALVAVKHAVTERVMILRTRPIGGNIRDTTTPYWEVANHPVGKNPRPEWFSRDSLAELRLQAFLGLPTAHDCAENHHLGKFCEQQASYVHRQVDQYLRETLPSRERELLDHETELWRAEWLRKITIFVLTLAFLAMGIRAGALLQAVCSAMAVIAWCSMCSDNVWIWLRFAPTVTVARFGAALLDRFLPSRRLRWAAFVLFVTGFGLDLLAS